MPFNREAKNAQTRSENYFEDSEALEEIPGEESDTVSAEG